jgi:hypothetical protein
MVPASVNQAQDLETTPKHPKNPGGTVSNKKKYKQPQIASGTDAAQPPPKAVRQHKKKRNKSQAPLPSAPAAPFSDDVPSFTAQVEYSVRVKLARCHRIRNFFKSERCRWRICGHRWGKDSCPSY